MAEDELSEGTADPEGEKSTEDEAGSQSTELEASSTDGDADGDADGDEKPSEYRDLMDRFEKLEGENRALRDTVQQSLTPPEPDPEPTPELLRNTERMEALEADLKDLVTERSAALSTVGEARGKIQFIQGQIDRADDLDKPELKSALAEAQQTAAKAEKEWRGLNKDERGFRTQLSEIKHERKGIESTIKEQGARQRQADEEGRKFQAEFPAVVDGLIKKEADALKIPTDKKVRDGLGKALRSSISMQLAHMGQQGIRDVNMPAMVKEHVQEFADLRNLGDREAFAKESEGKRSVQRQPARGRAAPDTDKEPPKPRWQDVEERTPAMQRAREGLEASLEKHARDEAARA